jgi:glutathione S-transferase
MHDAPSISRPWASGQRKSGAVREKLMKLYSNGLSPFAARVRAAIYQKGLNVEILDPPGGTKSAEYLALNPMGKVPVLQLDDGVTIPESDTIVEYLEDAFPEVSLRGATPEATARARLVSRVAELYVWPNVGPLFGQMNPKTRDQSVVDASIAKITEGLAHLEAFVSPGPFAAGERFTTADCWLIPVLFFVGMVGGVFGVGDLIAQHAKLAAYAKSIAAHPVAEKVTAEMGAAMAALRR